ncbi:YggS family pyridoxal phosphate-dependent enzyme [Micrococcales bacterium 31B]|nr:YggS family pyridoxal phosphate-dependent enzyme [Micrococcales bacterium 31B]
MTSSLAANLQTVRERIERAREGAASANVAPAVRLLVATKTQSAAAIRELLATGHTLIGENRVQEVTAKAADLASMPHEQHLIGPLQSNKINAVLPHVACVQTVDTLRLAEAIAQRLPTARGGRPLDVMVQVNVSGEPSKSGCEPDAAVALARSVAGLPGLRVTGLMTIGLNAGDEAAVRSGFARLRRLRDECAAVGGGLASCVELSMGMSGDLEWAIAEGATIVRVGTAIFGPRLAP